MKNHRRNLAHALLAASVLAVAPLLLSGVAQAEDAGANAGAVNEEPAASSPSAPVAPIATPAASGSAGFQPAPVVTQGTPGSTDDSARKSRVLEGGVKGTALPFAEGISRIGAACDLIQETTERILKEANRQDTIVMRGPNVLPNGTVIPALGGVGGVMKMGYMPMHKDKLARWIANTQQNIDALQSYVDALIIPSTASADTGPAYTALKSSMKRAQLHFQLLKELSEQKRPPNERIAAEAATVHDTMDQILKERSVIQQLIQSR
jgi:hypothetical protein